MRADEGELVSLVAEVAKALLLINSHNIVHSDLKTENILLKRGKEGAYIRGVKLIDFGSSFLFTNLKQFSMATPEYMPPEILNYILFQNKLEYDLPMLSQMERYKNPWVIDIWSLGCILLEIVSGVPLWMSIETRVEGKTAPRVVGLFAVKNRVFSKIIQKQRDVVANLDHHLDHSVRFASRRTIPASTLVKPSERHSNSCFTSTQSKEYHPFSCWLCWVCPANLRGCRLIDLINLCFCREPFKTQKQ
jgi:dual specificity tyrosine-phosphorylation-regulated kinase 2/3/4